ncbi:hypothetical protein WR25_23464 [Diploscapter pachys]|uniref:Transmembrane protein 33 n=1 Tax=Diploscapter pachys TaxID=2018661 RepID=A0A2A2LTL4_9BILA|nr:hypothetical protein WR25_23464 [Diploscapter pachys]
MVEIREESTERHDGSGASSSGAGHSGDSGSRNLPAAKSYSQFVSENMSSSILCFTRLLTLYFAFSFVFPIFSVVSYESAYYKTLAAAAATYLLRLKDRVTNFTFSREFLMSLVIEASVLSLFCRRKTYRIPDTDSFHYFIYSTLFMMSAPVTMALLPLVLYAALQAASFLVKMFAETGHGGNAWVLKLDHFTRMQTQNCLGIIACAEIFLVPIVISMLFMGKGSLLMPFIYYRFLTLRYASRRNPSTRQAFFQMRCSLEQVASSPSCPALIRNMIHKSIALLSSWAPPVMG